MNLRFCTLVSLKLHNGKQDFMVFNLNVWQIVEEACMNLLPNVLCEYLYSLSEYFTRFYTSCQVWPSSFFVMLLLVFLYLLSLGSSTLERETFVLGREGELLLAENDMRGREK